MKPNHLVDNILQATEILAKRYPGGWKNIRSIHLKTETSMSIPIHISNLSANDVGFVDTTAPQKVRLNFFKAKLLLLKLIHIFTREVLLVKKLEIKETKIT